MPTNKNAVTLGDLISVAYAFASLLTPNEDLRAELTARTVSRRLSRTGRMDLARRLRGPRSVVSKRNDRELQAA